MKIEFYLIADIFKLAFSLTAMFLFLKYFSVDSNTSHIISGCLGGLTGLLIGDLFVRTKETK